MNPYLSTLKACQFLKMKGIDRLDVLHARSHEEEEKRQNLRFLYWHVLQTDLLFRIFYGKPSALRWSSAKVKPPPLFTASNMQPKASTAMLYVIWVRYNVMTAELFNALDSCPAAARGSPEIQRQVDEYCSGLEELIDEWDMVRSTTFKPKVCAKPVQLLYNNTFTMDVSAYT